MFARLLCVPPIAHILKDEFFLSNSQVGLIFSLPIAILAVVAIPSGLLADRIGIRKAAGIGVIIMAIGSLMTSTATSFFSLFIWTSLFGVGVSLVYPNLPKLVAVSLPKHKATLATAIYITGIAMGASLATTITLPIIFPITNNFQGTFFIWSFPAIIASIIWWIIIRERSPGFKGLQDTQLEERNVSSYTVWKNKNVWLIALAFFCMNAHFYTWSGWSPTLMILKGATPGSAALIASVLQWIAIPVIFLMPWVSYKLRLKKPFLWVSTILLALVSLGAIYIPLSFGWGLMIVVGIILNGTFPMILSLPVEVMPGKYLGAASGIVLSVGYVGGLAGPLFAGYIIDYTGSLDLALLLLVGLAIVWACITFKLPETGPGLKS